MRTPISRRAVVKSAAWSIPVIAAAVAMPLTAASETPTNETGACLRFIGTNVTKKSVKVKVQNQCGTTARGVVLTIGTDAPSGVLVVPLGDIPPHGHAPTEHQRVYEIPETGGVVISASADNATTIVEVLR